MRRLFTCVMCYHWDYFPGSARWAHLGTGVNIGMSHRSARNNKPTIYLPPQLTSDNYINTLITEFPYIVCKFFALFTSLPCLVPVRYASHQVDPPAVIYTDRDCCNFADGPGKVKAMFDAWKDTDVRLDICHFMRRLASCVNSESHPLYPPVMSRLSAAIFEWDASDVHRLRDAEVPTGDEWSDWAV